MTEVKLDGKIGGQSAEAIGPHARTIYNKPGGRWFAIVELGHVERVQPAPDSEKEPSVKLRVTGLELPTAGKQKEILASVMQALYVQRTASGTLDEHHEVQLHENTLDIAADMLAGEEAARLRVYLTTLEKRIESLRYKNDLTLSGARAELRKIHELVAKGLGRNIEDAEAGLRDKASV